MKKRLKIGVGVLSAVAILAVVTNVFCATNKDTITNLLSTEVSNGDINTGNMTAEDVLKQGQEIAEKELNEGSVLLKNKNNTLPLQNKEKVTLLGYASYLFLESGAGSGKGALNKYEVSLYDALKSADHGNLDVNEPAWNALKEATGVTEENMYNANSRTTSEQVKTLSIDKYNAMKDTFTGYTNGYAIVTIARNGGEGACLKMNGQDGDNKHYLELYENEKDLLKFCKANFKGTILLVNSSNSMELDFLDEAEYNIDACLWIGSVGEAGMNGVANILGGKVNPSGRLVDTWFAKQEYNPTFYNTGDNHYANANIGEGSRDDTYTQYEEGIYLGYRFAETADKEGLWTTQAWKDKFPGADSYKNVVTFPFGYGLSYSSFSQKIVSNNISLDAHATNNYVEVEVKNTGNVAGKEVVELYMEAPCKQDTNLGIKGKGLEKASYVLIGFAKTDTLEPNASTKVKVYFDTDDLASYDYSGVGSYVLEKGDYKFSIRANAHEESNETHVITDATVSKTLASTIIYNGAPTSPLQGATYAGKRDSDEVIATNHLDDVSSGDGNMLDGYLSRSDFAAGLSSIWSHESASRVENLNDTLNQIVNCTSATSTTQPTYNYTTKVYENGAKVDKTFTYYVQGAQQEGYMTTNRDGVSVDDVKYKTTQNTSDTTTKWLSNDNIATYKEQLSSWEDPLWDTILDNISVKELIDIQGKEGWSTCNVDSIGKAKTEVRDGPGEVGAGDKTKDTKFDTITCFAGEVVLASTWNVDLAKEMGVAYGNQAKFVGFSGSYCPAMNTHRSPFGGRNFEYYSEDGFIGGMMGSYQTEGIMNVGVNVYIKHFALNDGDDGRTGCITWANEQAIREIYLKPFEYTIKGGLRAGEDENNVNAVNRRGADGIMCSLNRIGVTWLHPGMYVDILRDEWNFKGMAITDGIPPSFGPATRVVYYTAAAALYSQVCMLGGGVDTVDNASYEAMSTNGSYTKNYGIYSLRRVAKQMLYQYTNSDASLTSIIKNESWIGFWIAANVVYGVAALGAIGFSFIPELINSKKKED